MDYSLSAAKLAILRFDLHAVSLCITRALDRADASQLLFNKLRILVCNNICDFAIIWRSTYEDSLSLNIAGINFVDEAISELPFLNHRRILSVELRLVVPILAHGTLSGDIAVIHQVHE